MNPPTSSSWSLNETGTTQSSINDHSRLEDRVCVPGRGDETGLSSPVKSTLTGSNIATHSRLPLPRVCFTCQIERSRIEFSNSQWKPGGKCKGCLAPPPNNNNPDVAKMNHVKIYAHAMSNGLVDGNIHVASGKKVKERAKRAIAQDWTEAEACLKSFVAKFDLKNQSISLIQSFGSISSSIKKFTDMTHLLPTTPVPLKSQKDFLTTIRVPAVQHIPFNILPSTKDSKVWELKSFQDSIAMSQGAQLKFCSTKLQQHYITSLDPDSIV